MIDLTEQYEFYVNESKKDIIDPHEVDLDKVALEIPKLIQRWSIHLSQEKINMRQIEKNQAKWYRIMYNYYDGKFSEEDYKEYNLPPFPHKLSKGGVDRFIDADQKLNELEDHRVIQREIIEFIERKLKEISNRQWIIKAAIDHNKFMSGG